MSFKRDWFCKCMYNLNRAIRPRTTANQRVLIAIVSTHFATRHVNFAPYNFL